MSSFGLFWMCDSDNIGCGGVSGESNASKFGIGTNSFQNQLPISCWMVEGTTGQCSIYQKKDDQSDQDDQEHDQGKYILVLSVTLKS